jgi:hypothetical protein
LINEYLFINYRFAATVINEPEEELVKTVLKEIRRGVGAAGIQPGIIGEIGILTKKDHEHVVLAEWNRRDIEIAPHWGRDAVVIRGSASPPPACWGSAVQL